MNRVGSNSSWGRSKRPWRERLRRIWRDYQWPVLVGLELFLLLLGYIGFQQYGAARGRSATPLDTVYLTLQLVTLESGALTGPLNWKLEAARLLLPAMTAYTAAVAFAALFRDQVQRITMWFIRDHIVICGLGRKGILLADHFREQGDRVLCIEQSKSQCRVRGALALVGDATDVEVLRKAAVHRARWLIAVCGDDGVNAEIAVAARGLARRRKRGALTCVIHIVDPRLCVLLRERELAAEEGARFRLELFNIFDHGARILLREHPPLDDSGPPLDHPPRLLVVGLGGLGQSLIVHAARDGWHARSGNDASMRITVVDREADSLVASLEARYPRLAQVCELVPRQMDVRSAAFQRAEFLRDSQGQCNVDVAYICLDNDSLGLHAGLTVLQNTRPHPLPIVVRMAKATGLASLVRHGDDGDEAFGNLHVFGLHDRVCTGDLVLGGTHEILARATHEEYVRHQEQLGQTPPTNPLMVAWEALPESIRESNRRQVDHIGLKLRAIAHGIAPLTDWEAASFHFSADQVQVMARMEHERWRQELYQSGWAHAPGPKDPGKKTHPSLLPWDELPQAERETNCIAVRELPAFLARAGLQVYRLR